MDVLCENCAAMQRAARQLADVKFKLAYEVKAIKGEFYGGLQRWTKAAEDGTCRLCRLLFRSRHLASCARAAQHREKQQVVWQASRFNARALQCDLVLAAGEKLTRGVRLNLQVMSTDDACYLRGQRVHIGNQTLSPHLIGRLREWINICSSSHERCRRQTRGDRSLPLRLLDVNPDGLSLEPCPQTAEDVAARSVDAMPHVRIRLSSTIDRVHSCGGYLTLSHCWGPAVALKLTTDLLITYTAAVPLEDLQRDGARVFRDAIQVTRCLGFRYLWIDALCINQADSSEKAMEIGRMHTIYAEAMANLSATSAATGVDGMLFDRDDGSRDDLLPLWWSGEKEEEEEEEGSADARRGQTHDYMVTVTYSRTEDVEKGPVNRRGWVFQERCLASRIIHFCRGQVYWECGHEDGAETDIVSPWLKHYGRHSWKSKHYLPQSQVPPDRDSRSDDQTGDHADAWLSIFTDLVVLYSAFQLTYATDRLPAMAGIAQTIALQGRLPEAEYCAGLWRREFPQALLWFDFLSGDAAATTNANADAASSYTGPTWSWAGSRVGGGLNLWPHATGIASCVDVLSVAVTPAAVGGSRFGQLSDGRLRLRGTITKAQRLRLDNCFVFQIQDTGQGDKPSYFETYLFDLEQPSAKAGPLDEIGVAWNDSHERIFEMHKMPAIQPPDSADQARKFRNANGETVFMLPIGQLQIQSGAVAMHGLILGPTGLPNEYRRLGYFTTNAPGPSHVNEGLRLQLLAQGDAEIIELI